MTDKYLNGFVVRLLLSTYIICHVFSYQDTARRIARVSKEAKLEKDEEEYVASFKPQMMDIVHAWCNGCSFADICKMTEIFEGMLSGKQSLLGGVYIEMTLSIGLFIFLVSTSSPSLINGY